MEESLNNDNSIWRKLILNIITKQQSRFSTKSDLAKALDYSISSPTFVKLFKELHDKSILTTENEGNMVRVYINLKRLRTYLIDGIDFKCSDELSVLTIK